MSLYQQAVLEGLTRLLPADIQLTREIPSGWIPPYTIVSFCWTINGRRFPVIIADDVVIIPGRDQQFEYADPAFPNNLIKYVKARLGLGY